VKRFEIPADYGRETIVVYQAYRPAIAEAAVAAQRFVNPFSLKRMMWIKPSTLWMMHRSGWASTPGRRPCRSFLSRPLRRIRRSTRSAWRGVVACRECLEILGDAVGEHHEGRMVEAVNS
jgi:hypothetical protein